MSQGPTDRRDHASLGARLNDPLGNVGQGGGIMPLLRRSFGGAEGKATAPVTAEPTTPTPYTPPKPTYFRNEPGFMSGVFPHAGRWATWVDLRVLFPAAALPPYRAEATAQFGGAMSGIGPKAEGTQPSYDDDDIGELTFNRPWRLVSEPYIYDLEDGGDPTFDLAYSIFNNGGDYGGAISIEITLTALCVWGTPEP